MPGRVFLFPKIHIWKLFFTTLPNWCYFCAMEGKNVAQIVFRAKSQQEQANGLLYELINSLAIELEAERAKNERLKEEPVECSHELKTLKSRSNRRKSTMPQGNK